jgi:hypothetical protein
MAAFLDVMVDLETTGTDPAHAAIIQIAAVRFDLETKDIDVNTMFDRTMWMAPGRFWSEDTREWWGRQKAGVLSNIQERSENPADVVRDFFAWAQEISFLAPVRLWAKPTSFEFPFLQSYFQQFGYPMPFSFREAKDVNTYIFAKGHQPHKFAKGIEFQGDCHNALHDVLHQIKLVLNAG